MSATIVHLATGHPAHKGPRILDGIQVQAINSRLRPKPERPDPVRLSANAGRCFTGSKVYGQGFVLSPEERAEIVLRNPANENLIFPYIGGEEINTIADQSPRRHVINFGSRTLTEAAAWPDLLEIAREKVKPTRDRIPSSTGPGGHGKKYWWQFVSRCDSLYDALHGIRRCLVGSRVTKHLVVAWQPVGRVFSEATNVFIYDRCSHFAVLSCRIHEVWARLLSSSMRTDLRYAGSDCFETFPFPPKAAFEPNSPLNDIGKRLNEARARFMVDTNQGLTTTYNLLKDSTVHDPRIVELRDLHVEMDRAVLAAYGWSDIAVPPYTDPVTPAEMAAHEAFADEVIDRLFALNAERAAEEAKAADPLARPSSGPEKKSKAKKPAKPKKKPAKSKKTPSTDQGDLF